MSRLLSVAGIALFLVSCQPQAEKPQNNGSAGENRQAANFQKISLEGAGTLVVKQGPNESLRIAADSDILGSIESEVSDGELKIKSGSRVGRLVGATSPVEYHVTVKNLKAIHLEGAGMVRSVGTLKADTLMLALEGAATADLELDVKSFEVKVDGAGKVTPTGSAETLMVAINGVGRFDGQALKTQNALISIAGAGLAAIDAAKTLDVKIAGGGRVTYVGSPKVTRNITGAGSVEKSDG